MENYPGFELISGMILVSKMKKQAEKVSQIKENEGVIQIIKLDNGFEVISVKEKYFAKAVILAMGRKHRKLNIPGEKEFAGKGVSYCATCDGFFYENRKVVLIGGGNSALQEAIFLDKLGVDVTIVHRRNELRAEEYLQQKIKDKNIKTILNANAKEIKGKDFVESVVLVDNDSKEEKEIETNGVFVSIGSDPSSIVANTINVKLDEKNQIITDKKQKTNVKYVYSAGDVTGGLMQWIVACGEGAIAATSAFEELEDI
jgi:thioredoxin reductase (NADPH)